MLSRLFKTVAHSLFCRIYKSLVAIIFEVFQRLMFEQNTKRERRLRMLYRLLITYEETDELCSVVPSSGRPLDTVPALLPLYFSASVKFG